MERDEDEDEEARFEVGGEYSKQFGAGVVSPDVVAGGDVEDLGDPGSFSDAGVETIDAGPDLDVTRVEGDVGEAERLEAEEIDANLEDDDLLL